MPALPALAILSQLAEDAKKAISLMEPPASPDVFQESIYLKESALHATRPAKHAPMAFPAILARLACSSNKANVSLVAETVSLETQHQRNAWPAMLHVQLAIPTAAYHALARPCSTLRNVLTPALQATTERRMSANNALSFAPLVRTLALVYLAQLIPS